jgi:ferritin-like metal-binding protein YciE
MKLQSLEDVFADQVADLRSAEQQLLEALPKVAGAASNDKLREALEQHLEQTRGHVRRLDEVVVTTGLSVPQEHCEGMEGLLKEGEEVVFAQGDPAAKDAALIAAAQRVEHYEISGYGTARTLADQLGYDSAKRLLDETLDEESKADELLTKIADRTPFVGPLVMRVGGVSASRSFRVGGGGLPAEAAVWSHGVVGVSPIFDYGLRLEQRVEGFHSEHLVSDLAAEGFHERVLPG